MRAGDLGRVSRLIFSLLIVLFGLRQQASSASLPNYPWYQQEYVAKVWNNKNGLPQNTVFDIKKGGLGFVWAATEEGLVRFDGHELVLFNDTNLPHITSNLFYTITPSKNGGIWAATLHEIVFLSQHVKRVFKTPAFIKDSHISSLAEDALGRLWIGTVDGDLFYFQNKLFKKVSSWPFAGKNSVQIILSGPDGITIGTSTGLYQLCPTANRLTAIKGFEDKYIRSLAHAPDGSLWIGTKEHGIYHKPGNRLVNYSQQEGLPEPFITALAVSKAGDVFAGTLSSGIHQLKNGKFRPVQANNLPHDGVRSILLTESDMLWLGTAGSGLVQLKPAKVHMLAPNFNLAHSIVLPIYQHPAGDVWVGTAGQGITHISNHGTRVITQSDGLASNLILSLGGTKDAIFIGTPAGLQRYNLTTSKIDRHYTQTDGLASNLVQVVFVDQSQTVWIATRSGGLHYLDPEGNLSKVALPESFLQTEFVSCFEDRAHNKWFGSRGSGMVCVSPDGTIKQFTPSKGLPAGVISCFYQDQSGDFWLGTNKGLVYFNGKQFSLITKANGLAFNDIYQILDDVTGALWLSGAYGLQLISAAELEKIKKSEAKPVTVTTTLYDAADGMRNAEANGGIFPAGFKMQDGTLWFPTVEGIAIVAPAYVKSEHEPVKVHIEGLRLGDNPIDITKSIHLPPGFHTIEIGYTTINFSKPEAVHFYYRIKGLQDSWVSTGNRRIAYFTTQEQGDYVFEVKAELNGETSAPVQLPFSIEPFFYQTYLFKCLVVLLLFGAGYFARKLKAKYNQEANLLALVESRTKDLKESNTRFQLINQITAKVIWDMDLVQNKVHWAENLLHQFGYTLNEDQDPFMLWSDNIHPEEREQVTASLHEAITGTATSWQAEYRFQKADKQYAYILDRGAILRDENGKAIRMLGGMQDITKAKEEEHRLKLLESVITHANDAVLITEANPLDTPGPKIIYANEAFSRMTGYERNEVLGLSPRFLQGKGTDRLELDRLRAALQQGQGCVVAVKNYRKNGEEYFVNISISPITDKKGHLTHFISIQRDTTEQQEYLRAIEAQNKKLREITWIQSHVVRAPLARILGLINLLHETTPAQAEHQLLYTYIKNSGTELDGIIREIVRKAEKVESAANETETNMPHPN